MGRTLYDKIWDEHVVHTEEDGTAVLYIDRHLLHEVTSPQAFEGLDLAGRQVWRIAANLAVSDHNVPTTDRSLGIEDPISRLQVVVLVDAVAEAHQLDAAALVLDLLDEFADLGRAAHLLDLLQHVQAGLVGAAVRRTP